MEQLLLLVILAIAGAVAWFVLKPPPSGGGDGAPPPQGDDFDTGGGGGGGTGTTCSAWLMNKKPCTSSSTKILYLSSGTKDTQCPAVSAPGTSDQVAVCDGLWNVQLPNDETIDDEVHTGAIRRDTGAEECVVYMTVGELDQGAYQSCFVQWSLPAGESEVSMNKLSKGDFKSVIVGPRGAVDSYLLGKGLLHQAQQCSVADYHYSNASCDGITCAAGPTCAYEIAAPVAALDHSWAS